MDSGEPEHSIFRGLPKKEQKQVQQPRKQLLMGEAAVPSSEYKGITFAFLPAEKESDLILSERGHFSKSRGAHFHEFHRFKRSVSSQVKKCSPKTTALQLLMDEGRDHMEIWERSAMLVSTKRGKYGLMQRVKPLNQRP